MAPVAIWLKLLCALPMRIGLKRLHIFSQIPIWNAFQNWVKKDLKRCIFPTEKLRGVEKLYILAGLGGMTGSRFAEIAAKSAKSDGIGNVALIVTLPFVFEGSGKLAKATEALKSLSDMSVKVLNNEELTERYPDINFINAFVYSDKEALNAIESGLL